MFNNEQSKTSLQLKDILLILILFAISLIPLVYHDAGQFVTITIDGLKYENLDITVDQVITIQTEYGYNDIAIKNGQVSIISADCPDKICMNGSISKIGEVIACIPHKMLIEVTRK